MGSGHEIMEPSWRTEQDDSSSSPGSVSSKKNLETGSTSDNDSHKHDGSSCTGASDDNMNTTKEGPACEDTTRVVRLRILVLLVLLATAIAISWAIYHITREAELEDFANNFEAAAYVVVTAINDVVVDLISVAGIALAASVEKNEWPYSIAQGFQARANRARYLSGAVYISLSPLVKVEELDDWESFVQSSSNSWIDEGFKAQQERGLNDFDDPDISKQSFLTSKAVDPLHTFDEAGRPLLTERQSAGQIFFPRWQTSPVLEASMVNENLLESKIFSQTILDCQESKSVLFGGFHLAPRGGASDENPTTAFFATLVSIDVEEQREYLGDPMSIIALPMFGRVNSTNQGKVVGVVQALVHWQTYLTSILPETEQGLDVVLENNCDTEGSNSFTFQVHGRYTKVVGPGDRHDRRFTQYGKEGFFSQIVIEDGTSEGLLFDQDTCRYIFHIYPTQQEYEAFVTTLPVVISISVALVFAFTIGMFLLYDRLVERRQKIVLAKATHSTAIVSSLFPKKVRDRLLALETEKSNKRKGDAMITNNHKVKSFLNGTDDVGIQNDQPIADLFTNCTVMFSDIVGFTAWSSAREPAQVFLLLQNVYHNFDLLAKQRGVFKVETIGDSYVAVTGLPEPQSKHASIMARFAWDCFIRIGEITKELESSLGPDTAALSMRFGLHSGPVIAGVLRGDRARFQLFGDTVNTAARMESTSIKGRIQVSSSTAEALNKEQKGSWLTPRSENISAKGKGIMSTYWLALKKPEVSGVVGGDAAASVCGQPETLRQRSPGIANAVRNQKDTRLIGWVSELLVRQIKKVIVVHQRRTLPKRADGDVVFHAPVGKICLDEVQDAICTPEFDSDVAEAVLDYDLVEVPAAILKDIHDYVGLIAASYRSNDFHNFEHACHVTMSVAKLLGRVVAPDLSSEEGESAADRNVRNKMAAQIHNFTHGLTSDPLATFALVFAALIHDIDHQGVSNVQLAEEEPELAKHYRHKSVAEQNSLDIAWDLLMASQFAKMREYIFGTQEELLRFRQLIVNMVLATDIFDKELNQLRKDRWQRAFHEDLPDSVTKDLRATIVMEHIIQASDVSHTMQHWHIYQKWNRRLFEERHAAYTAGRVGSDPSTGWYEGELGFFDNYILPLASKLKECNVFGVSSDEYLAYAMKNREEWEERGQEIVQNMIAEFKKS